MYKMHNNGMMKSTIFNNYDFFVKNFFDKSDFYGIICNEEL